MKVHLLFPEADLDLSARDPWNAKDLVRDLALAPIFDAMANGDDLVRSVVAKVILAGPSSSLAIVGHRQGVVEDALRNAAAVRNLYALAGNALSDLGSSLGVLVRYPDWVLRHGLDVISTLMESTRRLREIAETQGQRFTAPGWVRMFRQLEEELGERYLQEVEQTVERLRLKGGVRLAARLGAGNKAAGYAFLRPPAGRRAWWTRMLSSSTQYPGFTIHPRDEMGARVLSELRGRALSRIAATVGKAAQHVQAFFTALRQELAFVVGAINLHDLLAQQAVSTTFPTVSSPDLPKLTVRELLDLNLVLRREQVVANTVAADGKALILITGANQGGKSTFLRSLGVAQLLAQSGLFVPAAELSTSLCDGLFTHYKREEDAAMDSGKLDEEFARMSEIVDHLGEHPLVLFNESFAATNEREGSEISREILAALRESGTRIVSVTHLFTLARELHQARAADMLFLRADRRADGHRSFRLVEGEPLSTSYGEDLYRKIFGADQAPSLREAAAPSATVH